MPPEKQQPETPTLTLEETMEEAAARLVEYRDHASVHPKNSLLRLAWEREAQLIDNVLRHLRAYQRVMTPAVVCRSQNLENAGVV